MLSNLAAVSILALSLPALADNERGIGKTTAAVLPLLDKGLSDVEEQHRLPKSAWLRADKKSKQKEINELLDDAVDALQIEAVKSYREEVKQAEKSIQKSQARIAKYQQEKLGASEEAVLGISDLSFYVNKEGYEQRIKDEQENIKKQRKKVQETRNAFYQHLKSIGVELSEDDFSLLLNTVNGEEFLDLKLVFDQVKALTLQLEKLTEESDEDVQQARRYFGMYTVLLRVLDRAQKTFLEDIDAVHLPKIAEFKKEAEGNIREAEEGLESGGDRMILKKNIESNKLTIEALALYEEYLESQRTNIEGLNKLLTKDILTADNTYKTVSLATQVVDLLRTGIRNYELLLRLEPPNLKAFENKELRGEIRKLTEMMRSS